MRNVTECQLRLIALGYPVGPDGADGKFGQNTLEAFNHFRASKGLGPVVNTSMAELNRLLFPEEQPVSPPKKPHFFEAAGVVVTLVNILKGKAMTKDQIGGVVRAILSAVAGYFVGKGVIDADTAATISGAVGTILVTAWSVWTNRPAKLN